VAPHNVALPTENQKQMNTHESTNNESVLYITVRGIHECVNQCKTINTFMYLCLNNGFSGDKAEILVNYELFCTTRKKRVLDTSHFSSGEMIN
jgi:hypothetical protein